MSLVVFFRNGVVPTAILAGVGAGVAVFAARWWFRE
jgi:hypothetical protein